MKAIAIGWAGVIVGCALLGWWIAGSWAKQDQEETRHAQALLAKQHEQTEEDFQKRTQKMIAEEDENMRQWGWCANHGGTFLKRERVCLKAEQIIIPAK